MRRYTPQEAQALVEQHGSIRAAARAEGVGASTISACLDPEKASRMANAAHRKARRRWSEQGLCTRCGRPPMSGTRCERCKEADRATARAIYYARRDQGLCVGCGTGSLLTETLCKHCLEMRAASRRKAYYARIDRGLCEHCGKEPILSETKCWGCLSAMQDRRERRTLESLGIEPLTPLHEEA